MGAILAGHWPLKGFPDLKGAALFFSPPSSCWADGCKAVTWPLLCIFVSPGVGNSDLSGLDPWLKSSLWVPFEHLNTHSWLLRAKQRFLPPPLTHLLRALLPTKSKRGNILSRIQETHANQSDFRRQKIAPGAPGWFHPPANAGEADLTPDSGGFDRLKSN